MAPAVAAQQQRAKQATITSQESLQLVQKLLTLSVYHVSYLRGLLPDAAFQSVNMQHLDGMELRKIVPGGMPGSDGRAGDEAAGRAVPSPEARQHAAEAQRLVEWVEQGMAHALERGYLHKCFFGFAADRDAQHLLEEYIFTFTYSPDGHVAMGLEAAGGGKGGSGGRAQYKSGRPAVQNGVDGVRKQICRLMRMLVEICSTLEPIPDERYVFVKLTYTDATPDDYEPPFFEPAGARAVGCFMHRPFSLNVGKVGTKHHEVSVAVRSVLDAVEEVDEEEGAVADDGSVRSTVDTSDVGAGDDGDSVAGGGLAAAGRVGNGPPPLPALREVSGEASDPAQARGRDSARDPRALDSCAGAVHSMPGSAATQSVACGSQPSHRAGGEVGSDARPQVGGGGPADAPHPETQASGRGAPRGAAKKTSFVERPLRQGAKRPRSGAGESSRACQGGRRARRSGTRAGRS